jgi:Heparinase II/III-like protein
VNEGTLARPHHRRRWSLADDGLRIDDLVIGRGRHEIVVCWHLSAGAIAEVTDRTAVVTSTAGSFLMTVKATTAVALGVEVRPVPAGSAGTADAPVLTCRMNADLPARVTSSWTRARGDAAQEMT